MSSLVTSGSAWYLMRASGVVSLILLTAVLALGIATANRWSTSRTPRFVTLSLHRSLSLLAVVFLAIHVATAVIDPYASVGIVSLFVPLTAGHSALWVGLGALSLDLVAALVVSSLLRQRIGLRLWRGIHWLAYASWPLALAHSLGTGTDAGSAWLRLVAAGCVAVVVWAVAWRLGASSRPPALAAAAAGLPAQARARRPAPAPSRRS